MDTPEKSSEYVKRVLFGGGGGSSKPVAVIMAPGSRTHRSESHSSAGSSAAGTVVSSGPETPKQATGISRPCRKWTTSRPKYRCC